MVVSDVFALKYMSNEHYYTVLTSEPRTHVATILLQPNGLATLGCGHIFPYSRDIISISGEEPWHS